ncbi:hypothetical protein DFH28DRAFT_1001121 [Melampsora americana]|nr:hypothetical protein DFH28DRAFT_1001121 [Melampsora americana]
MGFLSLFKSNKPSNSPDVFEKELSELELKIERHQDRLQAIKQREKSTTFTVTTYSLLFWCLYSAIWYMGWSWSYWKKSFNSQQESDQSNSLNQILEIGPIVLIPIGLIFARQLFRSWYTQKHESEQLQLRQLQKQLREKVEELKKKTSYYTTRELLERYDDKLKTSNNPLNRKVGERATPMSTPNTLRQRHPPSSMSPVPPNSQPPHSISSINAHAPTSQHRGSPSVPSPAGSQRGWADRFAEALLGDDEAKPETKYALICKKCLNHNGLVRQEELDSIQYVCPKCGAFNPAKIPRSHSPGVDGLPRSASAHPSYGRSSLDPFKATFAHPTSTIDEQTGEEGGGTYLKASKPAYSRKSLGITPSTSSERISVQQQKRSISSTLHDKTSTIREPVEEEEPTEFDSSQSDSPGSRQEDSKDPRPTRHSDVSSY